MEQLITECYHFIKDSNLIYAFCGGYALELFANAKRRNHSDIDITLFTEDRKNIIDYILRKGWDVYEHLLSENCLRKITDSNDEGTLNGLYIWAIKPDCSFIKMEPKNCGNDMFNFEILDNQQKNFDFIDIIFNKRSGKEFVCDEGKNISREIDKAILFKNDIPFLAPEVILYIISNPAYIESDYHREKNNIDFNFIPPLLSKESMNWLINAIEKAYPQGNGRLELLRRYYF